MPRRHILPWSGGWCYVKELIQPEYAQFFVDAGIAVLTFDYRNLGESEGEPRQHINPWEQVYENPDHLRIVGEACAAFAREYL